MIHPGALLDAYGRVMRDLRISVTDRCNFRCLYCLPETEAALHFFQSRCMPFPRTHSRTPRWQPRENILHFEEIERVARLAVDLGVEKIRLTGGEPLLRQELESLVERLARIPGLRDLAMTSNGLTFLKRGKALRDAGLHRVSFSLDSLTRETFQKMTGRDALEEVLSAIQFAQELGLNPVKVNAVIIRHINDHELEALADFGRTRGLSVRFVEFMPLDAAQAWSPSSVVPGREILQRLQSKYDLSSVPPAGPSATARNWAFPDGRGQVGIIASVTEPFCGHCSRLRLTADGKLRTCLFGSSESDVRPLLRDGASDEQIRSWLREVTWHKEAHHGIGTAGFLPPARRMSSIGG